MTTDRVLNGRYEVGELIGRGGMADVHLGRDIRLGRSVAIKVLRRDLARDPLFQSRFRREAQAVAALNHPTIVSVYDTGEEDIVGRSIDDVRVPFIVMEYVAGRTLRDLIRAGELSLEESAEHMVGVLSALEYSHKAGIVHRDIKPANVMITPEGNVKVMDFGIARAIADSAATMTQTQAVIGTAQYLSPEQARGETVDARSDLYSAGCLMYELFTARPPFIGDSPVSVAYQHVREEPKPASQFNPEVSPALDAVLKRALEKDRQDRFQDAVAFRTALQEARRGVILASSQERATEAFSTLPAATDDEGPQTRAMAKVLAGGSMSSGPVTDEQPPLPMPRTFEDPNDDDEDRRRATRRAWTTTFFIIVALVLAGGAFVLFNLLNTQPEGPVLQEVPTVEGMTQDEAANAIFAADLRPQFEEDFSDTVDPGLVIDSDPGAGAEIEPGSTVNVTISEGPSEAVIPEAITGMTESSARDALSSADLSGGEVTEENSATVPAGRVISTSPAVGESVPVGSEVDLVLSTGVVEVPRVIELPIEEATALLEDPVRGLTVRVEEVENAVVEPNIVTDQSADPESTVPPGTEIVLTVAVEPAPEEEPSSDPEPTSSASETPSEAPEEP
ncbi:Stk1 family PASTA domain-containing Ser/Thr kinase [Arthrobacter sp. AET 35A]|uniref:Stk1 family PASTA domain-containing Ser/Thr kinase n=1 Tax=Arthrobacter sp. 147(2020) TaxID=2735318 RepID=UPI001492D390|nr:Stk1 family PASTA domain-containing Ser/Thr kinase [Arthrobacter sp. AET 35A]MBE0008478.1 Stk1 family PASTA domain-containing Ser/Thr kinase [Arthrobacter sp. AET 35A]NOJ62218.1 Stk1 family PASTA domain-containing Ser/Thr kinase [Arthrobacter sp. 147(2020)]